MSIAGGSSVLEVFQLNKNSKEDDLEQCIAWLRDVFHDSLPKTISVMVKRLGGYDPLNTTNLSKSTLKGYTGLNSTVNASMMNNTLGGIGNQTNNSFNGNGRIEQNDNKQKNEDLQINLQKNNGQAASQAELGNEIHSPDRKVGSENHFQQNQSLQNRAVSPRSNRGNNQQQSQYHQRTLENNSRVSDTSNTSYTSRTFDENDPSSISEKAKQFYLNHQFQEALELYQRSQQLSSSDEDANIKLIFQNKIYIGSIYAQAKQRKQAIQELESAYQMRNKFNVSEIVDVNEQNSRDGTQKIINSNPMYFMYLTLGNLYNEEKDLDKAVYFFEEALKEIQNSQTVAERKNQALILNSLGMIYYSKNLITVSIEKFKLSLQIFEDLLKLPECANDPQLKSSYANRLNNLGEAYRRNKQIDEAILNFQESLKLKIEAQKENGDESIETEKSIASTHNNLGMSYFSQKKIDDAIQHLNMAIEKYERITQNNEPLDQLSFANILNQRGDCFRVIQDQISSCDDYRKSYKLKMACLGEENKSTLLTLNNYAQILFSTKNYAKSKQAFSDLLKVQVKMFGEKDLQVGQTLNNLGTVLSENQEYEQAEEKIKQAIVIFQESKMAEQNLERVQKNLLAIQQKKDRKNQQNQ